ncbi:hypothetical protein C8R31_101814 [Nitrosospira sp. Nsp2]|nr:hypothetical protein C8R31_101814 [Nitrosospira sp. Nsp2]
MKVFVKAGGGSQRLKELAMVERNKKAKQAPSSEQATCYRGDNK